MSDWSIFPIATSGIFVLIFEISQPLLTLRPSTTVQGDTEQVRHDILQCFYFILIRIVSHIFPSGEDKNEDEADHNTKDAAVVAAATTANDDNKDIIDNNSTIMLPKVKSVAMAAMRTAAKKAKEG